TPASTSHPMLAAMSAASRLGIVSAPVNAMTSPQSSPSGFPPPAPLMWWPPPAPGIEVPEGGSSETNHIRGAVHMQITTIGLDIAKNVFQIHGIDAAEKVIVRKQLRRCH